MAGAKFTNQSFKPPLALVWFKRSKFILYTYLKTFTKVIAYNNDIFYPNRITLTWI